MNTTRNGSRVYFETDGMEEAESFDDADVIVLNTCCIRENADNKLYGQLGNLKKLKRRAAGCKLQSEDVSHKKTERR